MVLKRGDYHENINIHSAGTEFNEVAGSLNSLLLVQIGITH